MDVVRTAPSDQINVFNAIRYLVFTCLNNTRNSQNIDYEGINLFSSHSLLNCTRRMFSLSFFEPSGKRPQSKFVQEPGVNTHIILHTQTHKYLILVLTASNTEKAESTNQDIEPTNSSYSMLRSAIPYGYGVLAFQCHCKLFILYSFSISILQR